MRALSELAATLDARKDLRREVTTLLSGVVFTSYVVAGVGGAITFRFTSPHAAIVVISALFKELIVWRRFDFRTP